jgi:hypothetical protein
MTGTLTQKDGIWVVKYDRGHEVLFYQLDSKSDEWTKKMQSKDLSKKVLK